MPKTDDDRTLTLNQGEAILESLGWRIRTAGERRQAIENFQRGWALGPSLKVDGILGPVTSAALRISESRRRRGLPTASAHFSFVEVRCKCGGKFSGCQRIWFKRSAFQELEAYRKAKGSGVPVVSGCRCVGHNRAVHGATHSRHMFGDAADFPPERSLQWFADHGLFSGRGWNHNPGTHPVRHGDMRSLRASWMYG
ncbi:D-Ala-D-Ala carboxypeptidase family metallohydrolase [Kineosporia sp. NBRC 101731]|uniref:D-Ala-D-Ala carboxypeptidase family metallohydrolase n=1 Tax=Kineosporia sp. NBRC 101731 TaxID=3032199 RepID=UPI0024A08E3B|nr:D-Ala-D-Ala carboxypeptidase family metallohydrolase [Kineosporia sp. NBRC 101731]GLY32145.1 hypothetical protein Kisp02_55100 [Kineosporia sp. NBRC 101731]